MYMKLSLESNCWRFKKSDVIMRSSLLKFYDSLVSSLFLFLILDVAVFKKKETSFKW